MFIVRLMFKTNWAIFFYLYRRSSISMRWCLLCTRVLDQHTYLDTLSWFRGNQYLLLITPECGIYKLYQFYSLWFYLSRNHTHNLPHLRRTRLAFASEYFNNLGKMIYFLSTSNCHYNETKNFTVIYIKYT